MTKEKADKIIKQVLKEDKVEIGIFISLLSNSFIKKFNMSEKEFILHLKNSLKILK